MSISSIRSVKTTPAPAKLVPDGRSPAVEASESKATKAAKQANGGIAPKAARASAGKSSSSTNDLAKLMMLASQHMSALQISHRLGIPVAAVMEEAAAAGINLNAGSTGNSSASTDASTKSANTATGKGTNIDTTA
jgi:hypothetical protein